jgi:protein phosphatase
MNSERISGISQKHSSNNKMKNQNMYLSRFYGITDTGKVRKQNQDYYYVSGDKFFFVIADGMGGHKAGEVASAMTVKHIVSEFERQCTVPEIFNPEEFFKSIVKSANAEIRKKAGEDPELSGMGTTVAIAWIYKNILFTCHVGDSRIYVIDKTAIREIGNDHSVTSEHIQNGRMTREEARLSNMKHYLTVRSEGTRR